MEPSTFMVRPPHSTQVLEFGQDFRGALREYRRVKGSVLLTVVFGEVKVF